MDTILVTEYETREDLLTVYAMDSRRRIMPALAEFGRGPGAVPVRELFNYCRGSYVLRANLRTEEAIASLDAIAVGGLTSLPFLLCDQAMGGWPRTRTQTAWADLPLRHGGGSASA